MAIRGEKFNVNMLPDDEDHVLETNGTQDNTTSIAPSFIQDVKERGAISLTAPQPPKAKPSSTGFPAHRKRTGDSRFKKVMRDREIHHSLDKPSSPSTRNLQDERSGASKNTNDVERKGIDEENRQRLAKMSDAEIAKERQELVDSLPASLLERLLRRSTIDDPTTQQFPEPTDEPSNGVPPKPPSNKRVTFEDGLPDTAEADCSRAGTASHQPSIAEESTTISTTSAANADIHFPRQSEQLELDPSSPDFLDALHDKYFPTLTHDPSKLAWMTEYSSNSNYSPDQPSVPVTALRFSFTGTLIPPRRALEIPTTQGLHHHGDAPESAGYTIPELAHLSRSSFPAQRCIAYRTLGRVMYRLGRGEFGSGDVIGEGEGSDLARGMWKCIKDGRVLETLKEEVDQDGGHASAKAYATEALWLWQKGGGNRWKAG